MDKYDRQRRLWGDAGQAALTRAHVVALGCTAVMAEALKGVVLAGVGRVTLVDDRVVEADDVAVNFYVTHDDARSRCGVAVATARALAALNDDCVVVALPRSLCDWTDAYDATTTRSKRSHDTTENNNSIDDEDAMTCALQPSLLLVSRARCDADVRGGCARVVRLARRSATPLLCGDSAGLFGALQTFAADCVVVRPHVLREWTIRDWRVFSPFAALRAWLRAHAPHALAARAATTAEARHALSHLPAICLVYHAHQRWCAHTQATTTATTTTTTTTKTTTRVPPFTSAEYAAMRAYIAPMAVPPRRAQGNDNNNNDNNNNNSNNNNNKDDSVDKDSVDNDSDDVMALPESYMEAIKLCTTSLNYTYMRSNPSALHALWADARCAQPRHAVAAAARAHTALSRDALLQREDVLVWYVLHAVKHYYDTHHHKCQDDDDDDAGDDTSDNDYDAQQHASLPCLPHNGFVPDMSTSTRWYNELRTLYERKHARDVACVAAYAWRTLTRGDDALDELRGAPALYDDDDNNNNNDSNSDEATTASTLTGIARAVRATLLPLCEAVVSNIWHICLVHFDGDDMHLSNSDAAVDDGDDDGDDRASRRLLARCVCAQLRGVYEAYGDVSDSERNDDEHDDDGDDVTESGLTIREACETACRAVAWLAAHELRRRRYASARRRRGHTRHRDASVSCMTTTTTTTTTMTTTLAVDGAAVYDEVQSLLAFACTRNSSSDSSDKDSNHDDNVDMVVSSLPQAHKRARQPAAASWQTSRWWQAHRTRVARASDDVAQAGTSEVAAVAAVVGAVAAQEVVKLLQRLRVPERRAMFYDGTTSLFYAYTR